MKWPFKRPRKWTDCAIVALTLGLLICAAIQAEVLTQQARILAGQRKEMERQREEMAGQRKEMADAGKQTDRIIKEDRRLANANEKLAQSMADSVTQAKVAMNRSLAQSKKSLEKTIEISRNDQRAWVGPTGIDRINELKAGSVFGIAVTWTNSGKTPALNFRAVVGLRHQRSGTALTPVYDQLPKRPSSGVLPPDATQRSLLSASLPGDLTKAISSGTEMLYDLTMQLKTNPEWRVWWRPARDEVTGEVLWPERWDAEALAAREREIGPRAFARQYMLQPLSDEERTFPEEVLAACRDDGYVPGHVEVPQEWPRYSGVDLAASLGQKSSWTAMMTVAVDPKSKRRYPLEIIRKRQHFPATIEMIRNQWEKHRPRLIHVESNAFQAAVVQELAGSDRSMPVRAYTTGAEKMDPEVGIPSLAAGMANGSWLVPTGGPAHPSRCDCGWCAWVRELRLHPGGEYSDCVMSMWLTELAARKGRPAHIFDERIENLGPPGPAGAFGDDPVPSYRAEGLRGPTFKDWGSPMDQPGGPAYDPNRARPGMKKSSRKWSSFCF